MNTNTDSVSSDRALLELAAKAAGMAVLPDGRWPHDAKGWFFNQVGNNPPALYNSDVPGMWAPLTDDGDALRLAVKLASRYPCAIIGIFSRGQFPHTSTSVVHRDGKETYVEQDVGDDMEAATRRAVVRAAAAIGGEA